MKKKISALIIAVFLIIPVFMFNTSAIITESADNKTVCGISFSDDYKTLYYNKTEYQRFDSTAVEWDYGNDFSGIKYNSDEIKSVDFSMSTKKTIITADIMLNDGSRITATYMNSNYIDEYNMLNDKASKYTVDFYIPNENNKVELSKNQILGEPTVIKCYELGYYDTFEVNVYSESGGFFIHKGQVIWHDDTYYYLDFSENNVTDPYGFYLEEDSWAVYEITDAQAIEKLEKAYELYNSDAIGFLTGDFTEGIGEILLFLIFGLIPLVALVAFVILDLRAKSVTYKKMFRILWIISVLELVAFVLAIILL